MLKFIFQVLLLLVLFRLAMHIAAAFIVLVAVLGALKMLWDTN